MKITHNKVGQNLNLNDSSKIDRADIAKTKTSPLNISGGDLLSSSLGDSTKVDLSPRAQEAKRIKELATSAPDVDEAKVAKFRKLIDEGKYNVDAKELASKIVDEELELSN
jgi:negative regulator of flagellin synthesis FlgM